MSKKKDYYIQINAKQITYFFIIIFLIIISLCCYHISVKIFKLRMNTEIVTNISNTLDQNTIDKIKLCSNNIDICGDIFSSGIQNGLIINFILIFIILIYFTKW
jgi:hypothetical protein